MPLSNDLNQPLSYTQPAQYDGIEFQNAATSFTHTPEPSGSRGRMPAALAINNSTLLGQQGGSGISAR